MHFLSAQIEPHCVASNAKAAFSDSYVVDYLETVPSFKQLASPSHCFAVDYSFSDVMTVAWNFTSRRLKCLESLKSPGVQSWDQNSKFEK